MEKRTEKLEKGESHVYTSAHHQKRDDFVKDLLYRKNTKDTTTEARWRSRPRRKMRKMEKIFESIKRKTFPECADLSIVLSFTGQKLSSFSRGRATAGFRDPLKMQ